MGLQLQQRASPCVVLRRVMRARLIRCCSAIDLPFKPAVSMETVQTSLILFWYANPDSYFLARRVVISIWAKQQDDISVWKAFVWETDMDGEGWREENQQPKVGFVSSEGRWAGIIIPARCWTPLQTPTTYVWKLFWSIAPAINSFVTWNGFTVKRSNRLDKLL